MLDVPERHLAEREIIEDTSETPDVALVADLDAGPVVAGLLLGSGGDVLDGLGGHEVEGAHLRVLDDARLVGLNRAGDTCGIGVLIKMLLHQGEGITKVDQFQATGDKEKIGRLEI